jgi:hypothetical protein
VIGVGNILKCSSATLASSKDEDAIERLRGEIQDAIKNIKFYVKADSDQQLNYSQTLATINDPLLPLSASTDLHYPLSAVPPIPGKEQNVNNKVVPVLENEFADLLIQRTDSDGEDELINESTTVVEGCRLVVNIFVFIIVYFLQISNYCQRVWQKCWIRSSAIPEASRDWLIYSKLSPR